MDKRIEDAAESEQRPAERPGTEEVGPLEKTFPNDHEGPPRAVVEAARPPRNAWDRMPNEGMQAYPAFLVYRDMGPDRTYQRVATQLGRHNSQISAWGAKYEWRKRTLAWDDHISARKDLERTKAMRAEAERTAREETARQQGQKAKFDHLTDLMLDKAKKMLEYPLATVTTKTVEGPGGTIAKTTIVQPGKWTFDTPGRIYKTLNDVREQASRNARIADEGEEREEDWMIMDYSKGPAATEPELD